MPEDAEGTTAQSDASSITIRRSGDLVDICAIDLLKPYTEHIKPPRLLFDQLLTAGVGIESLVQ